MEEGNDVFVQAVQRVLEGRLICVKHTEEGNDVFIQAV